VASRERCVANVPPPRCPPARARAPVSPCGRACGVAARDRIRHFAMIAHAHLCVRCWCADLVTIDSGPFRGQQLNGKNAAIELENLSTRCRGKELSTRCCCCVLTSRVRTSIRAVKHANILLKS
jgi:hypothetical protein